MAISMDQYTRMSLSLAKEANQGKGRPDAGPAAPQVLRAVVPEPGAMLDRPVTV